MSRDLYIKAKPPISILIADMFEGRVLADGGTFEAKSCLVNSLDLALFQQASLIITPNGRKSGKIFALKPFNGSGDLTVVRATTATEVNSSGVIVDVASNVARFDYTNGSCPSILVEPQRINLFLRSSEFGNQFWVKFNSTITENATVSPDGNLNADLFTATASGNRVGGNITSTGGNTITYSVFVKKGTQSVFRMREAFYFGTTATFDLDNGTIIGGTGTITAYNNDWYRCTLSQNYGVGQINLSIIFETTSSSGTFYLWGAQAEVGANATSYIPTVASAVTRNADVISKTGISSLINGESGTLFLNSASLANDGTTKYFSINDGTTNNEIVFQYTLTSNTVGIRYLVGGVPQCDASALIINALEFNKFAFTWQLNKFELWCNGIKVISDTSGNVTTGFNQINFRRANGTIPFFSKVKSISLWKTALTDTQLSQLTTP